MINLSIEMKYGYPKYECDAYEPGNSAIQDGECVQWENLPLIKSLIYIHAKQHHSWLSFELCSSTSR